MDEEIKTEETPVEAEVIDAPKDEPAEDSLTAEKERYLRLAAEYANYKNRTKLELENRYDVGKLEAVKAMLPVWDNVDRALKTETTDVAFKQGVELVMRQLNEIFEKLGISAIVAEPGTEFNPELHNAVAHTEDETLGSNVVAEELQKGFMLGDKVIRYSMVRAAN